MKRRGCKHRSVLIHAFQHRDTFGIERLGKKKASLCKLNEGKSWLESSVRWNEKLGNDTR